MSSQTQAQITMKVMSNISSMGNIMTSFGLSLIGNLLSVMKLIWYNSMDKKYEYGSSRDYKSMKVSSNNPEAFTILMEFTGEEHDVASKIIHELNIANDEKLKMAI